MSNPRIIPRISDIFLETFGKVSIFSLFVPSASKPRVTDGGGNWRKDVELGHKPGKLFNPYLFNFRTSIKTKVEGERKEEPT